ncbi:hypothetical protein ISS42_02835 [Candidatus Shapirobacteria bacterium]|nr:hypothetical protein [Candidatus Shapirobacteria bacterium]
MKKITKLNLLNIFFVLILFGLSFWAGKGIFKYNIFSTHDGDHHIARSFDAVQTIKEGHFPLRWAGSLNFNCGAAIYNFFYPLLYYLVIGINFLVKDIIGSLKIIYLLSLLISALFFYWWLKVETKNKWSALGGAILYLFAPYRFLLIFVRSSPEFLSYALLPVVLFFFSLCFEKTSKRRFVWTAFGASLAGGLLVISHNFTVMFLMPILLLYLIIKIITANKLPSGRIKLILFSYFSAFGLGAFFIFPALLEKQFVQIGQGAIINFREHFPTLKQLIRSPWDYFYSSPGVKNDGMSFQLGYAHWLILGLAGLFSLRKIFKSPDIWILFFMTISAGSIFLILPWSLFIWERIPLLQQIQFSWRLLGIAVFSISALFAFFLQSLKKSFLFFPVLAIGVVLAIFGNRNHLLPQPVSTQIVDQYDDFERLHPHRHSTTTLGDDILGRKAEESCNFETPLVFVGEQNNLVYQIQSRGNTFGAIKLLINNKNNWGDKPLKMGLEYFPGAYRFQLNGLEEISYDDCSGRVCLDNEYFREGANYLTWQIKQTPIEAVFNKVTLIFLAIWLVIVITNSSLGKYLVLKRKDWLPIALFGSLLLLFSFFRFYNLPKRIIFNWDQERDALAIKEIISLKKLTLIGPRVLGPGGFFLAPYFFYLLLPFYFVFNLYPQAIISFIIFINLTFFLTSFFVLKRIFNTRISFWFLSLWSIISWTINADTISWNPLLVPLLVLILLFALDQFFRKKQLKTIFFIGLIFGLGANFHIQFLLLLPFVFPVIINAWKKGRSLFFKGSLCLAAGIFLPFLPLVVFDLRHNFLNFNLWRDFAVGTANATQAFAFLPVWSNVVGQLLGVGINNWGGIIFYLVTTALFLGAYRGLGADKKSDLRERQRSLWLGMILTLFLMPLFFAIYGKRPSEYYFNYLLPLLIILTSFWLDKIFLSLKKLFFREHRGILIFAGLLVLILWFHKNIPLLTDNRQSLFYKRETAKFLAEISKQAPLNISFSVPLGADAGFRYLFDIYGVEQSENLTDPLIEVVVPPNSKPDTFIFGGIGVYIPQDWLSSYWLL